MFFSSSTMRIVAILVRHPRQLSEPTAAPDLARKPDAATVACTIADDREAEPGAPMSLTAADCANRSKMRSRWSGGIPSSVAHGHGDGVSRRDYLNSDVATCRREPQRVRDEVGERPGELGFVPDRQRSVGKSDSRATPFSRAWSSNMRRTRGTTSRSSTRCRSTAMFMARERDRSSSCRAVS